MLSVLLRMASDLIVTTLNVTCYKEVEVDASHKTFGVIGVRVASSVVHILLSHVEVEVDDLEWIVTCIKAESLAELSSKAPGNVYLFLSYTVCVRQRFLVNLTVFKS